jgi:uncharacterized protein
MKKITLIILAALILVQPAWGAYKKWVIANSEGYAAYKKADYATALKKWKPLAKKGYAPAQYGLGLMHARGGGVPKDSKKAAYWYYKAAMKGHDLAQNSLANMYRKGDGVQKDYRVAVIFYRRAADQGNANAQFQLGILCFDGEGMPKDYIKAYMWISLAAAQGNKNAIKNRDIVASKMTPQQIAEARRLAMEWKPTRKRY